MTAEVLAAEVYRPGCVLAKDETVDQVLRHVVDPPRSVPLSVRGNNAAKPGLNPWPVTHREREHSRLVVDGRRTDVGELCSLVVGHEVVGTWACYPYGAAQLGVRLSRAEAVKVAQKILDDAG